MKLEMTREKLWDKISHMSTDEVIDYFESYGLELNAFTPTPRGIYRREEGCDMVYSDGYGKWVRVDWSGYAETSISWGVFDNPEWWVRVLDENMKPCFDGPRILMDADGIRVG